MIPSAPPIVRFRAIVGFLRPRPLSLVVAFLGVAWAIGYGIQADVPVGSLRGDVTMSENGKPLDGADIVVQPVYTRGTGAATRTRYAVSHEGGKFTLAHVPAGDYVVSASSKSHSAREMDITVSEGTETQVSVQLTRSSPDLKIHQHQRVFGSREKAHFSISGYVNNDVPREQDNVQVKVYATRLSNVLKNSDNADAMEKIGRDWDAANVLPSGLLKPKAGPAPRLVSEKSIDLVGADKEGFYYQTLDFGTLPTGLYLVNVRHRDHKTFDTGCVWMLVTDTALVLKRSGGQVIAYVVNMKEGTPVAASQVATYLNGSVVAQGTTDGRGLTELRMPGRKRHKAADGDDGEGETDRSAFTTVAIRGNDEAVVWQNEYNNENNGQFAVHAYTDRPIYRPGQKIFFKGIARREETLSDKPASALDAGEPSDIGPRYSVPTGAPIGVEIRDPGGERILQQRVTANGYGSFYGSADLDPDAPTGVYTLVMNIDGERHTHDIVVAAYKKPEFTVTVTPGKKRYVRGETLTATVSGQYYFGAPLAGAKVEYHVYSSPDWVSEFPDDYEYDSSEDGSPDYHESSDEVSGESYVSGKAVLDDNGLATITIPPERQDKITPDGPQNLTYSVSATVTESANREVAAEGEISVSSGDFRISVSPEGYVAAPGVAMPVTIVARDYGGNPVANTAVSLEYGYEAWQRHGDEYSYKRAGALNVTTGPDGRVNLPVTPPRSGSMILKARAYDGSKHLIVGRASLWAVSDNGDETDSVYADLSLMTDKRRYNPGDTARVLINAEHTGESVLLSVEGARVYRTQVVPMTKRSMVVRVPIRPEYGPNIFLVACYVRDKKFARSETPLRVTTVDRDVKITIQADRRPPVQPAPTGVTHLVRYQPGDPITYTVRSTDAQGRPVPCEFSFGVVDEAIYALKEDDPTALRDSFYPRRVNQVSTIYSFAVVYRGDADKAEPQITARKRFPDTAYWEPALHTDANGQATIRFALPDSLTTWRATATAHTTDTRIGRAVQKVLTSKDFFVRLETPRFLTQRDNSRLLALVHNETETSLSAIVRITATNMTVAGDASQSVTVGPGKIAQVSWPVTAVGMGKTLLRVTAWTVGGPTYKDGIETSLPIRPHGRESVTAFVGSVSGARPETEVLRFDPTAVPEASRLTIRITPTVFNAVEGGLDYLIGYPYGCTEQTMSRFLPDMLVEHAMKEHAMPPPPNSANLPKMVHTGLARLYQFQHRETGGWGWWEHDADDPWMTAYVIYGLSTARAQGYPVSKSVMSKGCKAAAKLADKMISDEKAFLIYALASAGDLENARKLRKSIDLKYVHAEGLAHLILADKLLGTSDANVIAAWNALSKSNGTMLSWPYENSTANSDSLTATAVGLQAMIALNPNDPRILGMVRWLLWKRTGDYWASTRGTSWTLAALCDYLRTQSSQSPGGDVRIRLNGKLLQIITLTPDALREKEIVLRVPTLMLRPDKNDVTFERSDGAAPVFYSVELRQMAPKEDLPSFNPAEYTVSREYLRVVPKRAGQDTWTLQTEPTHNSLQAGDRIRVRLTIDASRDLPYVLIEDPFPAGCEVTERGEAGESDDWSFWWSNTDVRDDRIAFFARTLPKGKHVIEYNLRAQTPGEYHTLPTLLQAMYDPDTRAESMEARVVVK